MTVAVAVLAGGAAAVGVSAGSFAVPPVAVAPPEVPPVAVRPLVVRSVAGSAFAVGDADLGAFAPSAFEPARDFAAVESAGFAVVELVPDFAAAERPAAGFAVDPADLAAPLAAAPLAVADLAVDLVGFAPDFAAGVVGLLTDVSPSCGWLTVELLERDS